MRGREYYLITSLPSLGPLGSRPPLELRELLAHVETSAAGRALVEVLLVGDDLLQRQALLSGEIQQAGPAVLTPAQVRDQEPLPPYLSSVQEAPRRIATDAVWAAYYRHAAEVARQRGSVFLASWVGHEVALRNALAAARAEALGLEAKEYLVEPRLGSTDADFSDALSDWAAAPNPLAGLRVLDAARWDWLSENDEWFTFDLDELGVYAARLMLLHRWHRLAEARPAGPQGAADAAQSSERTSP